MSKQRNSISTPENRVQSFVTLRLKARHLISILLLPLMATSGCENVNTVLLGEATLGAIQAITLSDNQIQSLSRQAAAQQDSKNTIAPPSNPYAQRLNQLITQHLNEDGLRLNFKVYLSESINAFAMADGTIRVYSGLMDTMTDHELLFVIGHEIGHVKKGHSKEIAQLAYATAAARKGVAAVGGAIGALAQSQLGVISETIVKAQFSQREEKDADDYGLDFMRRNGYPAKAAVSSLSKLGGGGGGLLASHPDSAERAKRLANKL